MPLKKVSPPPTRREPTELEKLRDENRRLKDALFLARHNLVGLMDLQDLLSGHWKTRDYDQVDKWRQQAAAAVLAAAQVRPGAEMGDPRWPRALCPLCRRGAQAARDVRGFAVPEGLRRHLLGELNSQQCPVFAAAEEMARDSIRDEQQAGWRPNWT
jgi:hypothetical protein